MYEIVKAECSTAGRAVFSVRTEIFISKEKQIRKHKNFH